MRYRKINDDILLQMVENGMRQNEIASHFGTSPAAVCKRLKYLSPPPASLIQLSEKKQKFALAVASGKTQTEAAIESHDVTTRDSAKAIGCQLMQDPDIKLAIADLMADVGLTRRYRLEKLRVHVDSRNANDSLRALDQTWRLDGSYAPEKHINLDLDVKANLLDIDELTKQRIELENRLISLKEHKELKRID